MRFFNKLRLNNQSPKRIFRASEKISTQNDVAISSGETIAIQLNKKYIPYDLVVLTNLNDDNDVTVCINSSMNEPLPKGNSLRLNYPNVRTLFLTNDGATTIPISDIKIVYQNTGHQGQKIINKGSAIVNIAGHVSQIKGFF